MPFSNIIQKNEFLKAETYIPGLKPGGVWLAIHVAPIYDTHGNVVGVIDSCRDITERKRVEVKLAEAAEELAKRDQRKDEFLAMLAHELRNPLAPIRNAVEVLHMVSPHTPVLQRQRDVIARQVSHMARLLDDLLDVSRVTLGKIVLERKPLHLTDVLAHAVEIATPLIEARRHALEVAPPPDDLLVMGDRDRLGQAVGNLLCNSAKYTGEGGRIRLKAAREDGFAVVRVRDTGAGIDPEMLPRIFDLFAQADNTLGRAQGGLGIGLTMVKRLVEMHGGSVEARSEGLGKGSEFAIRLLALPAGPMVELPPSAPLQVEHRAAVPRRVLVVDDVADSAESLAELLGLWGHEVRAADDGPRALETARKFRPEVVLLDLGMPGMDGFEVARRLRRQEGGEKIKLVALTGYVQERDCWNAREAGFDAHLGKPVDMDALRAALVEVRA